MPPLLLRVVVGIPTAYLPPSLFVETALSVYLQVDLFD